MINFVTWYGLVVTAVLGFVAYLFRRKYKKAPSVLGNYKETIKVERHYSLHFSIGHPSINEETIQKESGQNLSSSRSIDPSR